MRKCLKTIFTSCRKLQGNHKTRASINKMNNVINEIGNNFKYLYVWLNKLIVENAKECFWINIFKPMEIDICVIIVVKEMTKTKS